MKSTHLIKSSLMLAAGLLLSTAASQAALSYHVTIDTSVLVGNPAGPFSLNFQLISGADLNNNTATINNFTYGGGSPQGTPDYIGGASGDIASTVTLTDSGFFNDFLQEFTAGGTLQFDLLLTQNVDSGPTPDSFSIAILDGTDANITTTGLGNTLLQLELDLTPAPDLGTGTGGYAGVSVTAVPEPSAAICGLLACGAGMLRRRRVG